MGESFSAGTKNLAVKSARSGVLPSRLNARFQPTERSQFSHHPLQLTQGTSPPYLIMSKAKTPLESVQACWERVSSASPVYNFFFQGMKIVSATNGSMTAEIPVSGNMINSKGGLHGSVSATIVDWAGGMAIASTGLEKTGLSTDIHVSYVSTAKEGDVLTIEGNVSKVGRNLGFTTVTIYKGRADDLTVVAHGTHTKYILRDQENTARS